MNKKWMAIAANVALVAVVACVIGANPSASRSIKRESTEWCDVWMPDFNDAKLPRVLLIGDSITRGYYPFVEAGLKGKAVVARVATSKAVGDPDYPREIGLFISEGHWDVIHFNVGMHGWSYSEEEYRQYLPEVLDEIRKDAPNAKLIWASISPVVKDHGGEARNSRIDARNQIAEQLFSKNGVAIDDLNTLWKPHPEMHIGDGLHFKPEGYAFGAKQVVACINAALAK